MPPPANPDPAAEPALEDAISTPPDPAPAATPALHLAGDVRLLVLDDDPAVCRLVQAIFADQEFKVDAVSDTAHMEAALRSRPYQLIILDYVLPGLPPERMIELIGQHQPQASIIVVTAFPSMDSALLCLRAHIYDYLPKPFQVDQVRLVVLRCLESRGLLRLAEEALREQLGAAIRERRKALGLTLADMTRRTNISLGYLSQIELGENSASIETIYRIALGLECRLAELFQAMAVPM